MKVPKTAVYTVISVVVLLVLLVGGGLAYTYYLGPDASQGQATAPTPPPASQQPKAVQQDPNARIGVSVSTITSPVAPGQNSSVYVRTNQLAKCKIDVSYGTTKAKDSGLADKTADEFGSVSWTWTVDAAAAEGTWPVRITCANQKGDKSAVVQADLVVSKKTADDTQQ